ncbi:hypothetical protein [Gluconobacter cerinus]|uniref:hypothetical protein n=1 Tax=Gluconobacter cerinus TaxID=38307 RepID=UPI001B8B180E|nr:hypothetical protein [Gluconobacter cerinus]MBS1038747.1 hypothetical protein [Gluconobacter cerinus]
MMVKGHHHKQGLCVVANRMVNRNGMRHGNTGYHGERRRDDGRSGCHKGSAPNYYD